MAFETFTTEDAYDASECGEPIMLSQAAALRMMRQHDIPEVDQRIFFEENPSNDRSETDAAVLLGWLGY